MKIIIIDAARGAGKTTVVQGLKNHTKECMVMQLSGIKKVENEKELIRQHYKNLHEFFRKEKDIPFIMFLDRTFTTEEMYCRLGFKSYSFTDYFVEATKDFCDSGLEIDFIHLITKPENFEERLKRNKVTYQNINYSVEASIKEQETFIKIFEDIKSYLAMTGNTKVSVYTVSNDTNDPLDAVKEIMRLTGLTYNK